MRAAQALLGVFDGHSGNEASRYLKAHLHDAVVKQLGLGASGAQSAAFDDDGARRALSAGFDACERALHATGTAAGASACVLMLQSGGAALNVAWCGDCRCVLSRGGAPVELTVDRSCRRPSTTTAVAARPTHGCIELGESAGGDGKAVVCAGGMARADAPQNTPAHVEAHAAATAQLAATGAPAKPVGLRAQPELVSEPLRAEDEFAILATDGLWDVMSPAEAVQLARAELRAYEDAQLAAEKLVQTALRRKLDDNVTVNLVRLFAPRPEEQVARQMSRQLGRRMGDRS